MSTARKTSPVNNTTWPSNRFYRLSTSSPFGINGFCQKNNDKKRNTETINRKKKNVSPVGWRSWHRPCPLEGLFFSQELFAQVSPLPLSMKEGKWDVCEKEPHGFSRGSGQLADEIGWSLNIFAKCIVLYASICTCFFVNSLSRPLSI